jgi:hypothetical protein
MRKYHGNCVSMRLLLLAALLLCGCTGSLRSVQGSGVRATEARDVAAFRSIALSGFEQVLVTIGDKTEVVIEADDNIVPLILTEVNNDTLHVFSKESYNSPLGVKLSIVTPAFQAVSLAGAGDVQVFKLQEKSFAVTIAGSGNVKAEGSAETGSGNVKVNVADALSARITGSGDIHYKGNPRVEQQIIGASSHFERASIAKEELAGSAKKCENQLQNPSPFSA